MTPNVVGPWHKWRKVYQTLTSNTQWAKWTRHNWWVLAVCTPPVLIHYSSLLFHLFSKGHYFPGQLCLSHLSQQAHCVLIFHCFTQSPMLHFFFPPYLLSKPYPLSSCHTLFITSLIAPRPQPRQWHPKAPGTQRAHTNTDMDSLFGSDSSVSSHASPSDMSYPPYSPFNTSVALTYQEPLLKENADWFAVFPIEHPDLWIFCKKAQASLWTAEEINLSKDCDCLTKLKQLEHEYIFRILAFFAASDGIVNENLSELCKWSSVSWGSLFLWFSNYDGKYSQWNVLPADWHICRWQSNEMGPLPWHWDKHLYS